MKWGICTTVKAPLVQMLAFVAWHKHLGVTRIWLHLDDADDVNAHILNQIDGVEAVLCDDAYWAIRGSRPNTQEMRQSYNIQRIYALAVLPVIAHLDVDEYFLPSRPIADILEDWDDGLPFIRCGPAEALGDPALADDIFNARHFRLPFPNAMNEDEKATILGDFAPLLPSGMLSHKAGKSLFRTGLDGFTPRIHSGSFGHTSPPIAVPKSHEIVVLHFHAQDRTEWDAAMLHRAVKGAYRFNAPLSEFLTTAGPEGIDRFYSATQMATPQMLSALAAEGLLIEADLQLKAKVEKLF